MTTLHGLTSIWVRRSKFIYLQFFKYNFTYSKLSLFHSKPNHTRNRNTFDTIFIAELSCRSYNSYESDILAVVKWSLKKRHVEQISN